MIVNDVRTAPKSDHGIAFKLTYHATINHRNPFSKSAMVPEQHRIQTPDDFLRVGLALAGFDVYRQQRAGPETNLLRFHSHYGSSPLVCAIIWADMLASDDIQEALIVPVPGTLDKFFLCLYFLKTYATEEKLSAFSKLCEKTTRKWVWYFASKFQALKSKKVRSRKSMFLSL